MVASAFGATDMVPLAGGSMTGTLTLDGSPPLTVPAGAGQGLAWISDSDGNGSWQGVTGARPEWFGTIGAGNDDVAINAAITAVHNGTVPGPVCLTQPYTIADPVTAKPGVNIVGTGQGNRQAGPPDTFTGGSISPSASFATGTPLITIGSAGDPAVNPCGITLYGVCLSGYCAATSTYVAGATGALITDTADVHLINCFLAGFDRGGATGTCVSLTSSTAGNGVGFELQNSVLSDSWQGLYTTGAGVTDLRVSGCLFHSNTQGATVGGGNLGGGGAQFCNDHFTYSGMPSTGWHLSMGSQAGDSMVTNEYFDQGGSAVVVQLATAKMNMTGCHFLATSTSSATSLVKVSTSGSQELTFCSNSANGNGSSIRGLLQTSAHSGNPTGGIYVGNSVFGTAASLTAVLIDSAGSAIADYTTAGTGPYIAGNRQFS